MLLCVDADYRTTETVAACLVCAGFEAEMPTREHVVHLSAAAPYQPGHFYLRELPALRQVLEPLLPWSATGMVPDQTDPAKGADAGKRDDSVAFCADGWAILIDGFVWLGPEARPGLGAHLYEALSRRVAVIGVAKTYFRDTPPHVAVPVLRGESHKPLYVTAVGMDVNLAAQGVRRMHGPHRLPTLLKRVDRLCREATIHP